MWDVKRNKTEPERRNPKLKTLKKRIRWTRERMYVPYKCITHVHVEGSLKSHFYLSHLIVWLFLKEKEANKCTIDLFTNLENETSFVIRHIPFWDLGFWTHRIFFSIHPQSFSSTSFRIQILDGEKKGFTGFSMTSYSHVFPIINNYWRYFNYCSTGFC